MRLRITVAGYHDDSRTAMRIYTEKRISYQVYTEAYAKGAQLKSEGMARTCFQCSNALRLLEICGTYTLQQRQISTCCRC